MRATPPSTAGTAIFAGGGFWRWRPDALLLSSPVRVLTADRPGDIPRLLEEVQQEQTAGRYVAGYLAYEAGAAFGLAVRPLDPGGLPLAWMAVYEAETASHLSAPEWRRLLDGVKVEPVAAALAGVAPALSVTREEYIEAIARVREYIAAGDTYQVNYTVRGRFDLDSIDPLHYFLALVIRQPVPYAAYLDLGEAQILSLSPEMFLRRQGRVLESRPMKGTRPRGATHIEDVALAYELAETEKERAENLMIVDMVRNDLGRVCRAGSVRVPTLFAVEPYRTVWQMVSTVTGEVNPRATLADIMRAVFPGASITGAPKHHTMEIIAELETEPREVYTGALGLFLPGGDFTTNIAIRTITHRQGRCKLGTGSGVVWDADAASEYDETLVKASFATPPASTVPPRGGPWRPAPADHLRAIAAGQADFYLFETLLLEAASPSDSADEAAEGSGLSRYRLLDEHLARMAGSALVLGLPFAREAAVEMLADLTRAYPEAWVVRLRLDAGGRFDLSTRDVPEPPPGPVTLLVSPFRTDSDDPWLGHKTSMRALYDREHRRAVSQGCFDALFVNRLDRVTEGAITSIFARFGDAWITPPLTEGMLPGLWRARQLSLLGAEERSVSIVDLLAAEEIVVGNSVRGTIRVERVLVQPLVS